MKTCINCKEEKPLTDYYKHTGMKDGRLNKCKECVKVYSSNRYEEKSNDDDWMEKERQRTRKKYHRLKYRGLYSPDAEDKRKAIKRYEKKYPEKKRARNLSSHVKPIVKGNHMHHWSYQPGYEKDLIELSESDHYAIHRYMVYDQERMLYRRVDGVLLDTKESHIELIKSLQLDSV